MAEERYYLGVDLGSVSLDAVVIDRSGRLLWHAYRKVQGRARDAVVVLCSAFWEEWLRPRRVKAFAGALATGSGKEIVRELLGIGAVNEIVAHGLAAARFAGGRASVIEIGGQDSKYILVDEQGANDYAMNELCAAGTGAFLDVQAERLGLSIEELSARAAAAPAVPALAGRCSVFAKSDIIHLQQRGVPVDQIVAGLCYALARNYVATLLRGRPITRPVVFQGGVALNDGVLRAFKDILNLAAADVLRPPLPHLAGAIGAALLAMENNAGLDAALIAQVAASTAAATASSESLAIRGRRLDPLVGPPLPDLEYSAKHGELQPGDKVFIGLDIGSISTKVVALSVAGTLLAEVYAFTAGQPLVAARNVLNRLAGLLGRASIVAVGVTGSGRKLVGHAVGADLVIDEITAQAKGAGHGDKAVDTVIEIGGQDAKFIRVDATGAVVDFEMNKVCAAGTGSFIQEQAVRLGVDLREEYSRLALASQRPLPFTSRCTVFMTSDLVHHIQQGVALADLLMGVSQAVVENYLARVVQGRKLGQRIVLQGGVAMNRSVVAAFRTRLKEATVAVHPHPGVSGAIGVAVLALEKFQQAAAGRASFRTAFKGLDFATTYKSSSFNCPGCENRCEVSVFQFPAGRFHFGDLCGRYSEAISDRVPGRDLTPDMAGLGAEAAGITNPIAVVGIPGALLFREYFPFWRKYFTELAIEVRVSGPSSSDTLALALTRLPAETCLPVKLLFGHVAALEKAGVGTVFIPSRARLLDGVSCPYIQMGAAMVHANFDGLNVITMPLVPGLPARERERLARLAAELFGVGMEDAAAAYAAAEQEFAPHRKRAGHDVQPSGLRPRPLAVLLGKPYNVDDRFINMSLAAKLAKAGFDVISGVQLDVPDELPLPERYNSVTWAFSRRMLKTGLWLRDMDDIYPVAVGNFGCGPDSFTFPLLQEIFDQRPSLFLEFDEHRADAGLSTRVEAFANRVAGWRLKKNHARRAEIAASDNQTQGKATAGSASRPDREYIIPYFSDHVLAFAGAFDAKKIKVRVLPLPDHRSYEAGVEFSGGRQCHPFLLMAGDLINLARAGDLPANAAYLIPTTDTNCLVTQYVPTMQLYMDRMGKTDVRVIGANSFDLLEILGPLTVFNMGKALLGIEYLAKLRFERRPYELEKGAVDKAYFAGLVTLRQRQIEERINQGIMDAALALGAVPTSARGAKPVIAITGDAYTRVNQAANGGLFDLLEELGCEVWPSPTLVDVIMAGQEVCARQSWEDGRPLDVMSSWARVLVNNFGAGAVLRNFEGLLANLTEPNEEEIRRYLGDLLPGEPELLVALNVAKHVDFANKGVDGILNVYCLNCLVGTATTALFKGLAAHTAGVPMMPLVFDAMGTTHIRNRVEAFVHRVLRNRAAKLATAGATAGRRLPAAAGVSSGHTALLRELFDRRFFDLQMPELRLSHLKIPSSWWPNGLEGWKNRRATDNEKNGH